MMNSTLKISLALAIVLLPAVPAEAAQKYCVAQVSERLDRLACSLRLTSREEVFGFV
jgi:hypothetical protein